MILFLMGLPCTGKTFCGRLIQEEFGIPFYEADDDLDDEFKQVIASGQIVPQDIRDRFVSRMTLHMILLQQKYGSFVVAQALPKEENRKKIMDEFKEQISFVLMTAPEPLIQQRLRERKNHLITASYFQTVKDHFEIPQLPHFVINNAGDREALLSTVKEILGSMLTLDNQGPSALHSS